MNNRYILLAAALVIVAGYGAYRFMQPEPPNPGSHTNDAPQATPSGVTLSDEAATTAGITTKIAGPQTIRQTLSLTGQIALNGNVAAQVKARFPGLVRAVRHNVGDVVAKDDVLAIVESNDSLQKYPVKAPLAGTIIARDTNVGDIAAEKPIFVVANLSTVWAELLVFSRDAARVKAGQLALIRSADESVSESAPIDRLLPVADALNQSTVARVTLQNAKDLWRPSTSISGEVVIAEANAPIAVCAGALQSLDGKSVVFRKDGDKFTPQIVTIGLSDRDWVEIREGLSLGTTYVCANSYLLKAELGKAGDEERE